MQELVIDFKPTGRVQALHMDAFGLEPELAAEPGLGQRPQAPAPERHTPGALPHHGRRKHLQPVDAAIPSPRPAGIAQHRQGRTGAVVAEAPVPQVLQVALGGSPQAPLRSAEAQDGLSAEVLKAGPALLQPAEEHAAVLVAGPGVIQPVQGDPVAFRLDAAQQPGVALGLVHQAEPGAPGLQVIAQGQGQVRAPA